MMSVPAVQHCPHSRSPPSRAAPPAQRMFPSSAVPKRTLPRRVRRRNTQNANVRPRRCLVSCTAASRRSGSIARTLSKRTLTLARTASSVPLIHLLQLRSETFAEPPPRTTSHTLALPSMSSRPVIVLRFYVYRAHPPTPRLSWLCVPIPSRQNSRGISRSSSPQHFHILTPCIPEKEEHETNAGREASPRFTPFPSHCLHCFRTFFRKRLLLRPPVLPFFRLLTHSLSHCTLSHTS